MALSPIIIDIGISKNATSQMTYVAIFHKEEILNQFKKMKDDIDKSKLTQIIIGISVVIGLVIIVSL